MHWSNFCIFVDSIDSQIILRMIRESKMVNAEENDLYLMGEEFDLFFEILKEDENI